MSEELRRTAYFKALARLQAHREHDERGHLSNISLQLEVLVSLLALETGSTAEIAKLTPVIESAMNGVKRLDAVIRLHSGQWPSVEGRASDLVDLAGHVRELDQLLESTARHEGVRWSVVCPAFPIWVDGGEPALREALTIAAVEMLFEAPHGGSVTIRVEANQDRATLRIEGPRTQSEEASWVAVVREIFARFGGTVQARPEALELDLIVPMAAVPR